MADQQLNTPTVETNKTIPGAPIKQSKKQKLNDSKKTLFKEPRVIEIEDDENIKIVRKSKKDDNNNNNNNVVDLEAPSEGSDEDDNDESEGSLKDFVVKSTSKMFTEEQMRKNIREEFKTVDILIKKMMKARSVNKPTDSDCKIACGILEEIIGELEFNFLNENKSRFQYKY